MNEQRMKDALESIAQHSVPNTNLWPSIAVRLGQKRSFWRSLRGRPLVAVLVVVLALLVLTSVAYAVGRLTSFIPGFGFAAGDVYILETPSEASYDGITVRVENAVSDESRFWVEISVSGNRDGQSYLQAFLLLPSGDKIQFQTSNEVEYNESETRFHYLFPPLERPYSRLTLFVKALGDETFSLPLRLRPVHHGELIPSLPTVDAPLQSQTFGGITLALDHVAQTPTETFLQVSLRYDQQNIIINGMWNVTLTDEKGNIYPLLNQTPVSADMGETRIFQTIPFEGNEQLTLRLVGDLSLEDGLLRAILTYPDEHGNAPSFTLGLGQNPQVGQTLQLDETLQAGNFNLHVTGARLLSSNELLFEFDPVEGVTGVMLYSSLASGASGGIPIQDGDITTGLTFDHLPTGTFDVRLASIVYLVRGEWEILWTPQPSSASLPNTIFLTLTPAPAIDVYATPTLLSSEDFLLEVEALSQKFNAPFQTGPGWIHILSEGEQRNAPGVVYPPPFYTREEWYEIGTEGYITRVLTTDRDKNGNIIQQTATVGNYSINFTLGEGGYNEAAPYRFTLDSITSSLDYAYQQGLSVTHEDGTWEGQPCLIITWVERLSSPQQNPGESQAFTGLKQRIWLNSQTGQQLRQENIWINAYGSEVVDSTYTFRIVETLTSVPQDVLDILAKVILP